ncbi:23S rRNA (pseudouridine(1915)-N(3))-methyltransferase RlmH [Porticoccus sp.]|uniref:23S rRNA (pseudouridine(1915)-N(3))-methyltransferase RlmH n=1 Tax=Porticoccus sp. TaxID=2024853 RepID=UPI000C5672CD|nr:23S rRNA (pseudouridine(1915)-N(3))-methyltransferase RlmH [Porticoccus sp.]MAZ69438.1 23S rRNA (pseudouridine(1915)-N(3))-methyltransferase RlmH [Porticoccus sp.]|tara:strand:+ start:26594 stop:27061 length:468 start_codon:yes stop_codon:yes gene_type:complete
MRLRILAIGTKMPDWVESGCNEYLKRLPPELRIEVLELPLGKRGKGADIQRAILREGEAMLKAIGERDQVIALEVQGKSWSTGDLAVNLQHWQGSGDNVSLLVGGPDGLAPTCLARADSRWSLSPLTLPHPLVRVLLAEQLYRAWSINAGHPYHR